MATALKNGSEPEFSLPRSGAVLLITLILCVAVGWYGIQRAHSNLAGRHLTRGQAYLKGEQYDAAKREFTRAEQLRAGNGAPWEQRTLVAQTDPRQLESFWQEQHATPVLNRLEEATRAYEQPKDALAAAIRLYDGGHPSFARYAVDRALELDPQYPEAWHYRYLIYDKLAAFDSQYRSLSEEARKKRDNLTSLYLNS